MSKSKKKKESTDFDYNNRKNGAMFSLLYMNQESTDLLVVDLGD